MLASDEVCQAGAMHSFGMHGSVTYEFGRPVSGSMLPQTPNV
jgi:hypothetical protein